MSHQNHATALVHANMREAGRMCSDRWEATIISFWCVYITERMSDNSMGGRDTCGCGSVYLGRFALTSTCRSICCCMLRPCPSSPKHDMTVRVRQGSCRKCGLKSHSLVLELALTAVAWCPDVSVRGWLLAPHTAASELRKKEKE